MTLDRAVLLHHERGVDLRRCGRATRPALPDIQRWKTQDHPTHALEHSPAIERLLRHVQTPYGSRVVKASVDTSSTSRSLIDVLFLDRAPAWAIRFESAWLVSVSRP